MQLLTKTENCERISSVLASHPVYFEIDSKIPLLVFKVLNGSTS